jgi:hemolysin activation/secretion protein
MSENSADGAAGRRLRASCAHPSLLLALALACWLVVTPVFAQIAPPGRLGEPGPEATRPALPEFAPEEAPEFELPPVPPAPERGRLSTGVRVLVREILITGNTVFSDQELAEVVRPYVGRALSTEDLLALRDALTRYYVERGYVNSGAVIPDQVVEEGVIEIAIVEGQLVEIATSGLTSLRPSFVEDRLRLGTGPPLNVNDLRERIQLLLTDPAIDRVNASLGPGARPGESRLEVDVEEAPRYVSEARIANDRSPSIGEVHGSVAMTFGNILGYSDPLRFELGASSGLIDFEATYSVPLTASDLRFFTGVEINGTDVVEEPFDELEIESRSRSLVVGLTYPALRTLDQELRLDVLLERERNETFLLDRPFSFSEGPEDGRSDATVLRLAQQWQARSQDQVLALRSIESIGLDLLGATVNSGDVPDGQFFAWLGQAQYARRIGDSEWQVNLRADLQLTPDPLLPIEQIAIGGIDTVRGYRENQLVRDNGWDTSAELLIPLGRLRIPRVSQAADDGLVQLVPFVDAGGGWNNEAETPDPKVIYSVGTGLRWRPNPQLFARLDFGVPLKDVPEPEDDSLQDLGIYFEFSALLY